MHFQLVSLPVRKAHRSLKIRLIGVRVLQLKAVHDESVFIFGVNAEAEIQPSVPGVTSQAPAGRDEDGGLEGIQARKVTQITIH